MFPLLNDLLNFRIVSELQTIYVGLDNFLLDAELVEELVIILEFFNLDDGVDDLRVHLLVLN